MHADREARRIANEFLGLTVDPRGTYTIEAATGLAARGLVYGQIDVVGSKVDLHSGSLGGNVQNPAQALAAIIARLKNDDGSIAR